MDIHHYNSEGRCIAWSVYTYSIVDDHRLYIFTPCLFNIAMKHNPFSSMIYDDLPSLK